jgi:hypothetical protein
MLAIKNKILNEADLTSYLPSSNSNSKGDKYAIQLLNGITNSDTFETLLYAFKIHSKAVSLEETASDYLNGCDGDNSPLSIFIYWLISPTQFSFYTSFLDTISTEKDYDENEWIIQEINTLLWTNPIDYFNAFELFIKHPIIGPHFSFWSAVWVNSDYYIEHDLDLEKVDEMYIIYLKLYKEFYHNKPVSRFRYEFTKEVTKVRNFTTPFTFSQYIEEVKDDLKFRKLKPIILPKFYIYLKQK